ncbi:hypothetical protein ABZS88_41360 [Streptomyces sp. NPDC005480]|uniref:hypothetical protein n=1 Tax=Streptomyces sp. NPDC005480 TaxID=3154880 RepID=UPI0033BBFC58
MTAPAYVRAVAVYYKESGGLACVVVDALCGPLVSMDGMQLVGRVPSELTDEFHDYQEGRGMSPMISVEGDAATGIACSPSWTAPWPTSEAPAQKPSLPRPRSADGTADHNDVSMAVAHLYHERDFRKSQVA